MRITIIGIGNVGCALAADFSRRGHEVVLLKASESYPNENFLAIKDSKTLHVNDPYLGSYSTTVSGVYASDYKEAVGSAEVIVVAVQTTYHEEVIKKMAPFLQDGQVVIFEPGYLATGYLLKYCDKDIVSVEAESSPIDCRISAPGVINVLFKNVINPCGVYPLEKKPYVEKVLGQIGFPFRFTENVFEAALHNPNLIVHAVGALFSIPRIEYTKGEYWMYKEVFTPHVWNVCESLDNEKMQVMEKLGISRRQKYIEACQERNFVNDTRDPMDSFFDYAMNSSPKGPQIPDSRYLTEDVSQGLVLLESLGHLLGVETPVATGIISLASASLGYDMRKSGRIIDKMEMKNVTKILADFQSHKSIINE